MGGDRSLFKNKYRIPSARLKGWDYSSRGWYFITINIKNKEWLFGEVIDNEMRFNEYGQIVREEWEKTFQIRRELICRTYIIMPDHIHGLVGIVELDGNDGNWGDGFKSAATKRINEMRNTPGEPV
jgi:putative transposase